MIETIRGVRFPFRIDDGGGVAMDSGDEKLRQNIIHIVMTGIGERLMRRDYGGGLRQLVHDPNNTALWAVIQHQIAKSVGRLEPRVLLQSLEVAAGFEGGESTLTVQVQFLVRRTRQVERLSVPIGLGGV